MYSAGRLQEQFENTDFSCNCINGHTFFSRRFYRLWHKLKIFFSVVISLKLSHHFMQTGQSFFKFLVEQIFHIFVLLDDFSILTFLGHTHYFCQS